MASDTSTNLETGTRIEEKTVRCRTGKYVLKNRTVQALLLTGLGKSLIYQYGLFGFLLSGFDPVPRQDPAVLVVVSSKRSNERGAIHVGSVFFVCILQSIAKKMKANKKQ